LKNNSYASTLASAFVQVGGNLELVVIPNPLGTYTLGVDEAPARARGGTVYFGNHPRLVPPPRPLTIEGGLPRQLPIEGSPRRLPRYGRRCRARRRRRL
jgi:hypothetical protein